MPLEQCSKCKCNLEFVVTPNGGRMACNYMPRHIEPGEGPDYGYEPRHLKRIEGRLVSPLEARERLERGEKILVQVWIPHDPNCPKRFEHPAPPDPDPAPASVERSPQESRLF